MATKLQQITSLAEQKAADATKRRGNWTEFLDTAARLYKYPFPEQMLIYAQRPDATSCASIEDWNNAKQRKDYDGKPWHRAVQRGSKGIALIDDTGEYPRLRYVFDISDTYSAQKNNIRPFIWEMRMEHEQPVIDALAATYDGVGGDFGSSLMNIARQLAEEHYDDNAREIGYSTAGSFLEDYDEPGVGAAFKEALTVSVAYSLMSRCNVDTSEYFEDEDFQCIFDFNTPATIYALGTASSDLTRQVLRDIERTIKKHERQQAAERSEEHEWSNNVLPIWGLSPSQPDAGRAAERAGGADRQVRQDSQGVPEGTQDDKLQHDAPERDAVPAPPGDRAGGTDSERPDNGGAIGEGGAAGQGIRPDGLGGVDGQHPEPGGGGGDARAGVRPVEEPPPQANPDAETDELPPQEGQGDETGEPPQEKQDSETHEAPPEQGGASHMPETYSPIGNTPAQLAQPTQAVQQMPAPGVKPISESLANSAITLPDVDAILRDGGNAKDSHLRIAAFYMKSRQPEENAGFLHREYLMGQYGRTPRMSGKGFKFGDKQVSAWFEETGISLGIGNSARTAKDYIHITWDQAAARIHELLSAGHYLSGDVLAEAIPNEHRALADSIMGFYRDIREWRDMPEGWRPERGGWPDCVDSIAALIADPAERINIVARLTVDIADMETDPDAPKRFYQSPSRLLDNAVATLIEPVQYRAGDIPGPGYSRFITEDEIDGFLTRGGAYSGGRLATLSFFLHEHTPKELADFVRDRYNNSGSSDAICGADDSWYNGFGGKIALTRGQLTEPYAKTELSWSVAATRIGKMIQDGRYATREDLAGIPSYERIALARMIDSFYYNLPRDEYPRPFPEGLNFSYPNEDEWAAINGLLDNPSEVAALLGAMRPIFENTPEDDRYHKTRSIAFKNLEAYQNGEYTLFPGVGALPDPELAQSRKLPFPKPPVPDQMSLFDAIGQPPSPDAPPLPSVKEQEASIEQTLQEHQPEAEISDEPPAPSLPITQDEIDTLLLAAVEKPDDRRRLAGQLTAAPRSRETAALVKELYGSAGLTMGRGGAEGYIGILGEDGGVAISSGLPYDTPDRPEPEQLALPWAKVHRRLAELAGAGRFAEVEHAGQMEAQAAGQGIPAQEAPKPQETPQPQSAQLSQEAQEAASARTPLYNEYLRIKAENPGVLVMYQLGDSYELFGTDAETASKLLEIQLDTPEMSGERIPMCGVPAHMLEDYVGKLRDAGYGIVLSTVDENGERGLYRIRRIQPEETRPVGQTVLMPTVFDENGNYNREDKRRKVKIAQPLGAHRIYTRDADYGKTEAYVMTSSGRLMYWSETDSYRFTEEHISRYAEDAERHVAEALKDPGKWVDYNAAATADRLEEAEAHNNPIREARSAQYEAEREARRAASEAEAKAREESFNLAVDDIGRALVGGERADIPKNFDKNPLLALFALYGVNVPLGTKGWINRHVRAVQLKDSTTTVWGSAKEITETFSRVLHELREAAALIPPERQRSKMGISIDEVLSAIGDSDMERGGTDIGGASDEGDGEVTLEQPENEGPEPEKEQEREPEPGPELEPETLLSFDEIARTVLSRVMQDREYLDDLHDADSRSILRNPCDQAVNRAIMAHAADEPRIYSRYRTDDNFNDRLFDYVLRQSWEQSAQRLSEAEAELSEPQFTEITDPEVIAQVEAIFGGADNQADAPEKPAEQMPKPAQAPVTPQIEPPAVFFVNWEEAKADFDLTLYKDHGVIGYDKDGVEYALGRSGNLAYVTSTGAFWGDNAVPGHIYEQIQAYINGETTAEQVRENCLQALESFKAYRMADISAVSDDVLVALSDGLFAGDGKDAILSMLRRRAANHDIAAHLKGTCAGSGSVRLTGGETANFAASDYGIAIDVFDGAGASDTGKASFSFAWEQAVPILRALEPYWRAELKAARDGGEVSGFDVSSLAPYIGYYGSGIDDDYDDGAERGRYSITEMPDADSGTYCIWDSDAGDYFTDDFGDIITFADESEARGFLGAMQGEEKLDEQIAEQSAGIPATLMPAVPNPGNFRITDGNLGEGGAKAKFRHNIDAINTLFAIERENRYATPEEQEALHRYVGWGGLPQAFDPDNGLWQNEYHELSALLKPEEYEKARASTINAHYTSPTVIKPIYEAIQRLGFKTGNIIDPGCGVGNFFGLLPEGMGKSKLYGVELDSITARIARHLYPDADIQEKGYEKTGFPDSFFDLVIGNVPFGDYGVADKRYDRNNFSIHNYFFAKALDQVRPGGIVAMLTSKYTLDEKDGKTRKYLAQRADLLGAVRLPNNAFLKNAGTETTTDIIILQKRDRPADREPGWVHLGYTGDGIPVNRYYADNPEMVLGLMALDERMNSKYGTDDATACLPIPGADLVEQLRAALANVQGQYAEEELDDIEGIQDNSIPADPSVKNFSYTLVGGDVFFRENSRMYPVDLPQATLGRIAGMIGLRDCVSTLIDRQLHEYGDSAIKSAQDELSALYDGFIAEYGLINSVANSRAFSDDSAYYLLCALEVIDEDGRLERKADMFTKRTIKQRGAVTHVDTAVEALPVSLAEKARVDIGFMAELAGTTPDNVIKELEGVIFCDFGNPDNSLPPFNPEKMKLYEKFPFVPADEYLSGNVREKLAIAEKFNEAAGDVFYGVDTTVNIAALRAAMPKDLDANEISVRLGATWIDPEYVKQFVFELLKPPLTLRNALKVNYSAYTCEWQVEGKNRVPYSDINATVAFGTNRMNAYQIIEDTLNLRDVRIYDYIEDADGNEKRVLNKKDTTLAQQKQEEIKQAFKEWVWSDPERRHALVRTYNDRFNSIRPREYDGSHINFVGMNIRKKLEAHQQNAVARILYGGNTLLAQVVGAGKSYEMIAACMEARRLGLAQKNMICVPNHLTEQMASEFLTLYPSANILVAKKKDFEMRNRKKFCAKIATGDYDAVIIGHTQLEKIPMSAERQERQIRMQIEEIEDGIKELKRTRGDNYAIKKLEKTKKSLEARITKLLEAKKRDDVVTFEQLGVDRLYVDEAHNFKNLFLYTKMRNVAGVSTTEAQKSSDLYMKCRYMDELTGGMGVIFATGTPVSNSMTELYTMKRYLQHDDLARMKLLHFDAWASTFGETVTAIELAPEGTGYRARTRFAKFFNLPELMSVFREVADIQTADMLNLPTPKAVYETVVVPPSDIQKELVQSLSERAADVHAQRVDPHQDNMLKITTDGRKTGLDQRLINPLLPDHDGSKVNACAANIYRVWGETAAGRLTQLAFCDFSTPKGNIWALGKEKLAAIKNFSETDKRRALDEHVMETANNYAQGIYPTGFNVYDDIKAKLILKGVPADEIAFIHDADTEARKKELFAKVRQGKVRVLFGSTFKMGAGTNVQERLIALHDLDCPWRPADLEQRSGRIIRQGNNNPEVYIFRYVTEATFDAYLYQTVENKQKFIAQIMTSKSPVRSCEDVDETALSYAEIKALCAGDPRIKEKMDLDIDVARLRLLKADHKSQRFSLEDDLMKYYPEKIATVTELIAGLEKDIAFYGEQVGKIVSAQGAIPLETGEEAIDGAEPTSASAGFPPMTILGVTHTERSAAGKALMEACKTSKDTKEATIGKYLGFDMGVAFDSFSKIYRLTLKGCISYPVELHNDAFGNITRINNALKSMPERLEKSKAHLETLHQQVKDAQVELQKPFAQEAELAQKESRLAWLNSELDIDGGSKGEMYADAETQTEIAGVSGDDDFESGPDDTGDETAHEQRNPRMAASYPARQVGKERPSILDGISNFSAANRPPSAPGRDKPEQAVI